MTILHLFALLTVLAVPGWCPVAAAPGAVPSAAGSTQPDARSDGLSKDQVERFLKERLLLLRRRDESIFDRLTDAGRLLDGSWNRRVLRYKRTDRLFWGRTFPRYHFLSVYQIQSLRVTRSNGPLRASLQKMIGGDERKTLWKTVPARFVIAEVRIPRLKPMTCRVYAVEGELFWQPFGW